MDEGQLAELHLKIGRLLLSKDPEISKEEDVFDIANHFNEFAGGTETGETNYDWFPTKELTYAISVDPHRGAVMVVFRGAITRADWVSWISSP